MLTRAPDARGGFVAGRGAAAGAARLQVEGVSLSFGGLKALRGVSFDVEPGSITALIGPNGAGKTSMFNCISGFYKPQQGAIRYDGQDVTKLHPPARAGMGFARTFQNIALFRGMTVLDNIKLGRHSHLKTNIFNAFAYWGRAAREEMELRAEVEERIIDFLEINHIRNSPVAALSYGLQKRVELARALAMHPRILLLDEPVAGMNREETEDMARFILDVKEEWGTTILMVEHDMGMVMDISDHVVVLNFGEVIARGLPHEVQRNKKVAEAYLGSGDPAALKAKLSGKPSGAKTVAGEVRA
ncbi:ABC transporter ATP-binding protein [Breoghania sp.]|uniref:ABC transporter ATP-binding protein n=1 Tax=Breoghania sp. TaxID=2065378 RepID=UPI002AA60ABD|nr:ABC transporter ATP-binding protein [Breoghania sp.]